MGLDRSLVGVPSEPQLRSWDSKDALLYAVGVGAGLGSPLEELEFTTENCEGIEQKVLPTFGVLIAQARAGRSLGDFNRAMLVHAEQFFELHRPLPVTGTVRTVSTVTGIYDKGSGALVVSENVATDAGTGEPLVTARSGTFIRGEGGFGGPRGAGPPWERPGREPDQQVVLRTRPEQAASASRSCTVCAPTESPAGLCCTRYAARIPPGSGRCLAASATRCCRASR
jgi:hypothetical protein